MRLLLLLCLTLGAARAEIPLQLLAEFDLPPGTGAWDVQHWMDDSTFGWAGEELALLRFEQRVGEGIDSIDVSYIACVDGYGPEFGIFSIDGIAILKESDGSSRFRAIGTFSPNYSELRQSSLTVDLQGNYNCTAGAQLWLVAHSYWTTVNEMTMLPELPLVTERIVVSTTIYHSYEAFGAEWEEYYGFASVSNLLQGDGIRIEDATFLRPFPGPSVGDLGGAGYYEGSPSRHFESRRSLIHVNDTTVSVNELCSLDSNEPQDTTLGSYTCRGDLIATTAVDRLGRNLVIQTLLLHSGGGNWQQHAICFDASTSEILWQQPDIAPSFTVCRNQDEGQLAIEVRGDRFYAYSVNDGALLDSSVQFPGELQKVFKTGRCESEIITKQGDTIRAYKLVFPPRELTISIAPIGGQIILRWQPIATASYYRVCRNVDYSDDLCANGEVYMTTDTTMVLTPWDGATQEYYRVTPVFE